MDRELFLRARRLRSGSTDAEHYLWYFLRSRSFASFKFRRQYVMGDYIVDFICIRKKLIIELDGGQHALAVAYDQKRTEFLESRGYTVLRFWNNELFIETDGVLSVILENLENR